MSDTNDLIERLQRNPHASRCAEAAEALAAKDREYQEACEIVAKMQAERSEKDREITRLRNALTQIEEEAHNREFFDAYPLEQIRSIINATKDTP